MKRLLIPLILLSIFDGASVPMCADDGPAKDIAELKPLQNFVGSWDNVLLSSKGESSTSKWILLGKADGKWVLGGRFVEQTVMLSGPDRSGLGEAKMVATYDQEKHVYRMWIFIFNGFTMEAEGQWEPKHRTLTLVDRNDNPQLTITVQCADKEFLEMKIRGAEQTGKETAVVYGSWKHSKVR